MPSPSHPFTSSSGRKACTGPCTGFGTTSSCPPLIVLAAFANHPHVLLSKPHSVRSLYPCFGRER